MLRQQFESQCTTPGNPSGCNPGDVRNVLNRQSSVVIPKQSCQTNLGQLGLVGFGGSLHNSSFIFDVNLTSTVVRGVLRATPVYMILIGYDFTTTVFTISQQYNRYVGF